MDFTSKFTRNSTDINLRSIFGAMKASCVCVVLLFPGSYRTGTVCLLIVMGIMTSWSSKVKWTKENI